MCYYTRFKTQINCAFIAIALILLSSCIIRFMDGSFEASDITSQYIRMTITLPYDQIISIPTTNISNGLKLSVITVENNTQKIITVKVHGTYGNSERTVIRTKKIDE